jgi:hypothetical protein
MRLKRKEYLDSKKYKSNLIKNITRNKKTEII